MAPEEICKKRVAQAKTRYRKDTIIEISSAQEIGAELADGDQIERRQRQREA